MQPRFADKDGIEDAEPSSRRKASKKPRLNRAKILPPEEGNGTVTELFPNQCAARLDGTAEPVLCSYRMSTLAFGSATRERSPVCVGDRIRVEAGVIVGRCERRNRLIRPAPNTRDPVLHALVANIDCLVIVSAAREPEFSCDLIDRFLVAASAQKIPQILCVNKSDLIEPDENRAWSHYPAAGVVVVETCARDGRGMDDLLALLRGKVAVFCGHSGVGKTSLLRRLLKDENYGRVGAVNQGSGKGRHTTSGAVLLPGPEGSSLIDTPGITNFGLIDVARDELLAHFPELHAAAVKCPADCVHDKEPACALRTLPRYASYREILRSLI